MRTVLRLLGTRYGISMVLVVVVIVIVVVARSFFDTRSTASDDGMGPVVGPGTQSTTASAGPTLGDDSVTDDTAKPSLSAGTPDATTVATKFVNAWLRKPGVTGQQWRDGIKPFASPELMALLKDVDPTDVPATTVTGPAVLAMNGVSATVRMPADGGTIVLELEATGGRWLVSTVDWEKA